MAHTTERPEGPLRVAAYCRVSTDKEDQRSSLAAQQTYFAQYIQGHQDWAPAGVFADEGLSGTSASRRPQFRRMVQLALAGEIDLIVTKEVSRFARNTVDTLALTRELKAQGVGVIFLNDGIDTRQEDGEFRLTIMASVAQEESRKISQRTRWGQAQAMKRGVVFGNDSLYGYTLSHGRLTVRPEQAEVVRAVYRKFLAEGKGTYVIARELTQAGVAPPLGPGDAWSSTAVLRLLRNEKYTGDLLQQKYLTTDHLTHKKIPNDGRQPQLLLRDHHEAIVSRADFLAVQEELARRRDLAGEGRRYSGSHWYSGKVVCGLCGKTFTAKTTHGKQGQVYRRFVCRGRAAGCPAKSLSGKGMEAAAAHVLALLPLDRQAIRQSLLAELEEAWAEEETGAAELHRALARQRARRQRALEAYLDGTLPREEWASQAARCQGEIDRLQARLAAQEAAGSRLDQAQRARQLVDQALAEGPWLLDAVIQRVTVFPDHLLVGVWELPLTFRVRLESQGSGRSHRVEVADCQVRPQEEREGGPFPAGG